MDGEKNVKAIDGIYKNILEKFNPESKKMLINAKTYLKALHNSSQASKVFADSLSKIARNARESTQGTSDIGSALMEIIDIFNFIEEQHMSILKAFYVDFICPLETNLDKDIKVIQLEQKKFAQQFKMKMESFDKATAAVKKNRKKKNNAERELKCIQILEEEKKSLDNFCDQSYKNAVLQERRRYGFVLERYTESVAKHYLHFFNNSFATIDNNIQRWSDIASTREIFMPSPLNGDRILPPHKNNDNRIFNDMNQRTSIERESLSVSDESVSNLSIANKANDIETVRSRFSMDSLATSQNNRNIVFALFGHTATSENQLNFSEGDKICLIGENLNGWQFGENLSTKLFGWFPSSYVDTSLQRNGKESETDGEINNNNKYQSVSKQRKFQNPPMVRPPSPPLQNVQMEVQKSMRGMYSSNDSGFSNEMAPVAPEVDYSDDEMPQKVSIRKPTEKATTKQPSVVQSENSMDKMQSNSYSDLTIDRSVKRNKTFWRFSKSEDVLEGMSLWKHRDLLPIDGDDNDKTLRKSQAEPTKSKKKVSEKHLLKEVDNKQMVNRREKMQDDHEMNINESLYDEAPKRRNHTGPNPINMHSNEKHFYKEIQDTNFYDDEDEIVMRTVKRKEILKQYHSSETDIEDVSVNSDPYDCIFVNDHLVPRSEMNMKKPNTLLPRTKLSKGKHSHDNDNTIKSSSNSAMRKSKTFEPWHNMWDDERKETVK